MSWEEKFERWSLGPGKTEAEKCRNAETMICGALNDDETLSEMDIEVFTQGSYKARTNISSESDVDICILNKDFHFSFYPDGFDMSTLSKGETTYTFYKFKDEVEAALVRKFGKSGITRGNKAFEVHENSYRWYADVVPAFRFRRYTGRYDSNRVPYYYEGIRFLSDKGDVITNYPEQTYKEGVAKHERTNRIYKKIVRILKNLRTDMQGNDIAAAKDMASFLIESLVWNVPDNLFSGYSFEVDTNVVLDYIAENISNDELCDEWTEVNDTKYLFRSTQPWTRTKAYNFILAARKYIN